MSIPPPPPPSHDPLLSSTTRSCAQHWVSQISYLPDLRLLSIGTHTYFGVSYPAATTIQVATALFRRTEARLLRRAFTSSKGSPVGIYNSALLCLRVVLLLKRSGAAKISGRPFIASKSRQAGLNRDRCNSSALEIGLCSNPIRLKIGARVHPQSPSSQIFGIFRLHQVESNWIFSDGVTYAPFCVGFYAQREGCRRLARPLVMSRNPTP